MQFDESRADRLQVVARIEPFGDRPDLFPQCLPVAQESRTSQDIDLRAGIVDIILAGHRMSRETQEIGQGIPEHGSSTVADMERPGRIGRDIFDVDGRAGRSDAVLAAAECHAARERSP